jgi:DNA-binding transcriptional LysR family regulator
VRFESTDVLFHARLTSTGHAAAFLPDLCTTPLAGALSLHDLPGKPGRELICAVRRGSAQHPAHLAVRDALRESLSTLAQRRAVDHEG